MNETLAWLGLWSMILWIIGMLRSDIVCHSAVKVLLFPGLALDAVLRSLTSFLTLTPVIRWSPFGDGKPFLETGESRLGFLSLPIAVAVRVLLTFVGAYIVLGNAPQFLESRFALPLVDASTLSGRSVHWESVAVFWRGITQLPTWLTLNNPVSMLLAYALLSYTVAAAFDHREFFAAALNWGIFVLLSWSAAWLGVKFGFLSRGWFIRWLYVPEFWSTFSLLVLTSGLALGYVTLLRMLRGSIRVLRR